jgi:hypothetical protein
MLEYLLDAGELATVYEPYDGANGPQRTEEIRQDECSTWGNYALFLSEQQGSYCQLV